MDKENVIKGFASNLGLNVRQLNKKEVTDLDIVDPVTQPNINKTETTSAMKF